MSDKISKSNVELVEIIKSVFIIRKEEQNKGKDSMERKSPPSHQQWKVVGSSTPTPLSQPHGIHHWREFLWNDCQSPLPHAIPTRLSVGTLHSKDITLPTCLHRLMHVRKLPTNSYKAHFFPRNNTSLCFFSVAWHVEQRRNIKYWCWSLL